MYVDAPPGTYRELLQKSEHVGFHDTCSLLCVCVCDLISIFLPFTWLKISLGVKHMDADHLNRQNILRLENLINSLWTVLIRISQKDLFKNEFKSIAQAYIFLDQERWDTAERWMPCYFFLSWNVHVRWNLKKKKSHQFILQIQHTGFICLYTSFCFGIYHFWTSNVPVSIRKDIW